MFATAARGTDVSCDNCDTMATPLWRRAENGSTLCNACGLFLKLHNRPRPIELKTNIIRSRNRVKVSRDHAKRKTPYDAPATPGEIARLQQQQQQQLHQQQQEPQHLSPYEPHPRTMLTATQHDDSHSQFTENVFDPQLSAPANSLPQGSNPFEVPNPQEMSSSEAQSNKLGNVTMQEMETTNRELRARVNELEIVNDLFRSHVTELEAKQNSGDDQTGAFDTSNLSSEEGEIQRQTIKALEQKVDELQERLDMSSTTEELDSLRERNKILEIKIDALQRVLDKQNEIGI